jgi:hypothetical protein
MKANIINANNNKPKYAKPLVCAWCNVGKPQHYAQTVIRHAQSHGVCDWHKRFLLASMKASNKTRHMRILSLKSIGY